MVGLLGCGTFDAPGYVFSPYLSEHEQSPDFNDVIINVLKIQGYFLFNNIFSQLYLSKYLSIF